MILRRMVDMLLLMVREFAGFGIAPDEPKEKHARLIRLIRKTKSSRDRIVLLNYAATIRKVITNG